MSVKTRIPQGRSKIPCSGPSKLPFSTARVRSSDQTNTALKSRSYVTDNYRFTFVKSGESTQIADLNANKETRPQDANNTVNGNSDNLDLDNSSVPPNQDREDNCEVISFCSAEPSPLKHCEEVEAQGKDHPDNYLCDLQNTVVLEDRLNALQRSSEADVPRVQYLEESSCNDFKDSTTSSCCSSVADFNCNSEKRRPKAKSKQSLPKRNKTRLKQPRVNDKSAPTKPSTTSAFVTNCISGPGENDWHNTRGRTIVKQKRIVLPAKSAATIISASNAMDYVRRITSESQPRPTTSAKILNSTVVSRSDLNGNEVAHHVRPGRKISAPAQMQSRRNDGKWASDLDTVLSFRGSAKSASEEKQTNLRADRKKLYHEAKTLNKRSDMQRRKNYSEDLMHADHDVVCDGLADGALNAGLKSPTADSRKQVSRTAKIARPVARPPRRRLQQEHDDKVATDDIVQTANTESMPEEKRVDQEEAAGSFATNQTRRRSVPSSSNNSPEVYSNHTRRRISELPGLQQDFMSGISEESGYGTNSHNSLESGDWLAANIARRKDRLRKNERYKDILSNPDIVNFGQWRIKREGNYAPEEKYGVTERQRIRSSTDSDSLSPVRSPYRRSASEESNTNSVKQEETEHGARQDNVGNTTLRSPDIEVCSSEAGSRTMSECHNADVEDPSQSYLDDLPSLNSTALMGDYSLCSSNTSTNQTPDENHMTKVMQSSEAETPTPFTFPHLNGGVNTTPNSFKLGLTSSANANVHSSPLRTRTALDDITRFSEALNDGNLMKTIDEMQKEYRIVRTTLENLYKCLNEEEQERSRIEAENMKLRNKNEHLTEEVNRLTRILEIKQTSAKGSDQKSATQDARSQTEEVKRDWCRSGMSSVDDNLLEAVNQLTKGLKDEIASSVATAEKKFQEIVKKKNEK